MAEAKKNILELMKKDGIDYQDPVNFQKENVVKDSFSHSSTDKSKIEKIYVNSNEYIPLTDVYLYSKSSFIFFCECCFEIFECKFSFERHKCSKFIFSRDALYEEDDLKLYKIQGIERLNACQNICILGRCFIKNKTLYLDVSYYNFFLLYQNQKIIGFFTEESLRKEHNLSCIVILPEFQRKGFGTLLVDISYHFKKGTPEKPFSADGRHLYFAYWKYKVYNYLEKNIGNSFSIYELSNCLHMDENDLIHTLELLNIYLNNSDEILLTTQNLKEIRLMKLNG